MAVTAVDLFSGPGGLSIGMKQGGVSPIVAVEKSRDAVDTYDMHTPEAEHFNSDIRNIDFKPYRGKIDAVFGGPPCQPFSSGGLQRGTADARNMFPEYLRAIEEIQPSAFVCENVLGLASKKGMPYLAQLLEQFTGLGFKVTWQVLLAADFGVPQKRKRLFIVGLRDKSFHFPNPTHGPETSQPHIPSGAVISKLAPNGTPPDCPVIYAKYPDPRRSPYAGHVYNGGGRPIDLASPCHTILASSGGYKTHWVDTMDIAPYYSAHLMAGGKPREGEVPGARRMTIEESALIQSFPSDMKFCGSRSSQYTQIGDAVPPLLATHIAKALVSQLNGRQQNQFMPESAPQQLEPV